MLHELFKPLLCFLFVGQSVKVSEIGQRPIHGFYCGSQITAVYNKICDTRRRKRRTSLQMLLKPYTSYSPTQTQCLFASKALKPGNDNVLFRPPEQNDKKRTQFVESKTIIVDYRRKVKVIYFTSFRSLLIQERV